MIKKLYFCMLAICLCASIAINQTCHASETQETPSLQKRSWRKSYRKGNQHSLEKHQISCEEKCKDCVTTCMQRRADKEQRRRARVAGIYNTYDKRSRHYRQGYGRKKDSADKLGSPQGRPLYKQRQSMAPNAPSRKQLPSE